MDKKYITLFKDLAASTAISAEKVMDYDKQKKDDKGYETAQMMRDNYQDLKERIEAAGDTFELNKSDAAKLVIASIIFINQLQDQITNINNTIKGYNDVLVPVLKDIVENAETDEEAIKMANEKFVIKEQE